MAADQQDSLSSQHSAKRHIKEIEKIWDIKEIEIPSRQAMRHIKEIEKIWHYLMQIFVPWQRSWTKIWSESMDGRMCLWRRETHRSTITKSMSSSMASWIFGRQPHNTITASPHNEKQHKAPPSDAHLESYDDNDKKAWKEYRQVQRDCDKEQVEAGQERYSTHHRQLTQSKHELLVSLTSAQKKIRKRKKSEFKSPEEFERRCRSRLMLKLR